jgi:cobalt/nickel transport protein
MKPRDILIGLAAAFVIAAIVSPFASSAPDGLEWAAEQLGFIERSDGIVHIESPLPGYQMSSIKSEGMSTAVAGIVGTALVVLTLYGAGRLVRRRSAGG